MNTKSRRNVYLAVLGGVALLAIACGGAAQASSADYAPNAAGQQGSGRALAKTDRAQARFAASPKESANGCPPDMASIDGKYCVDRYEGSLVEVLPNGEEQSWSPFKSVEHHVVRAVSQAHVFPQGYISANQAVLACKKSNKRLCKPQEWRKACMGPEKTTYGYGNVDQPRRCNDHGVSPVIATFGAQLTNRKRWNWDMMNQPSLNQMEDTLAKAGDFKDCTNGYGVYDMVGNLHEWVADPGGTFYGGYYQDTHLHGDGCTYTTVAHSASYHDYSTGFRCCADPQR